MAERDYYYHVWIIRIIHKYNTLIIIFVRLTVVCLIVTLKSFLSVSHSLSFGLCLSTSGIIGQAELCPRTEFDSVRSQPGVRGKPVTFPRRLVCMAPDIVCVEWADAETATRLLTVVRSRSAERWPRTVATWVAIGWPPLG